MKKRNFFKSVVSISILISILGFSFVLFTPWIEVVLGTDFTFLEKRQGTIMIGVVISFFISIFAVFYFIKDGKDFNKYVESIESGIDLNITVGTPGGGSVDTFLPLNLGFFWPDVRI
jgi:uncharacterized membrane protein (DUF485 family)